LPLEPRRRFRFLKELAEGSFGKVYLAEMVTGDSFSTIVAIKLLHGKWLGHEEIVMRARDEARLLGLLRHRHIVRVEDLTSISGQCAVVMEYLQGVDLKTLSTFLTDKGQRYPFRSIFEITAAVASALDAAYNHEPLQGGSPLHVIHRDIKPSNVMVTAEAEVKVLDFGTAQATFADREARTQALSFGSQAYMAPERVMGDPDAPASDVFSLGIMIFELIKLDRFGSIHVREEKYRRRLVEQSASLDLFPLTMELADRFRAFLVRMLDFDASARPAAAEVVDQMEEMAEIADDLSLRRFCKGLVAEAISLNAPVQTPGDPLTGMSVAEDSSSAFGTRHEPTLPLDVPSEFRESEALPDSSPESGSSAPSPPSPLPLAPPAKVALLPAPARVAPPAPEAHAAPPLPTAAPSVASPSSTTERKAPSPPLLPADHVVPVQGLRVTEAGDSSEPVSFPPALPASPSILRRLLLTAAGALIAIGLGGGVLVDWLVSHRGATDVAESSLPVSPELPSRPDIEPAPVATVPSGPTGNLTLVLDPPGSGEVTLSSLLGYRKDWDGQSPLDLPNLPEGAYKTKISPKNGSSVRSTVNVVAGKSCSYAFHLGAGKDEWENLGCE
jgi:serine/threonine protein kinase